MYFLIVIITLIFGGINAREVLKIGAIFEESNYDFDRNINEFKEKALNAAIKLINQELKDYQYELEAIQVNVDIDNPFGAVSAACTLIENGVIAILGPSSEDNSNVVQSVCDNKDIPHLEVRWDDQPVTPIINLYPYQDVLTRVYMDIITAWEFDSFVILYENNESLRRVGELLKLYDNKKNKIIVRQLDKAKQGNYRPVLKELWRSGAKHFVLDCSIDILEEVLKQAQQIGLMTYKESYIVTNLDFHTLELAPFQYSETNITGMRFIDPETPTIINLASEIFNISRSIADIAAWKLTLDMALVADAVIMFGQALKDLPVNFQPPLLACNSTDTWPFGSTLTNLVKSLKYTGFTGNIQFDNRGFRSDFGLELIELKEGGVTRIGNWTTSEGLNISRIYPPPPPPKEGSLANRTFIITGCLTEPYIMRVDSSIALYGNDRYEGFAVDLIHELSQMEGFNYTFSIRTDGNNGKLNNVTGEWDGMIGEIIDGSAHLAIGDLTINSQRESAVDFTTPFMTLGISIVFQKPQKADPSFFSFADPLAFDVWKMLVVTYFGASIVMFILGRICPAEWQNPYPCIEEPDFLVNQLSLRNCFWFMTGSLMQQGSEIAPIAISTRMVAGIWWFFTLIMVSSYTANLASFLTTDNPEILFEDVNELVAVADAKGIKYGAKAGGATASFFLQAARETEKANPIFKAIGEYMSAHADDVMVAGNSEGVIRAEQENYAFFMESTSIEYETERRCTLQQVGNPLDEKGYGIAMKKNSTFRSILSTAILKLQESGKITDLKRKWWQEKRGGGQCPESEDNSSEALNLKNVGGVFWVTIGGACLSLVFMFVEMALHMLKRSIKTKIPWIKLIIDELKFYFKFSGMVKPVIYEHETPENCSNDSEQPESKSKSKSKSRKESSDTINLQSVPYGFISGISQERLTRTNAHYQN